MRVLTVLASRLHSTVNPAISTAMAAAMPILRMRSRQMACSNLRRVSSRIGNVLGSWKGSLFGDRVPQLSPRCDALDDADARARAKAVGKTGGDRHLAPVVEPGLDLVQPRRW